MIATKPFTAIKSIPPERSTTTLKKQLDIAYEDRPARSIALEKYNEIAQRKEARMTKLDELVSRLTAEDKSFIVDAPYLLELASKAVRLSESSRSGLRNKMLKILFSNLSVAQKTVLPSLLEPFTVLSQSRKMQFWLPRPDSNWQPRS